MSLVLHLATCGIRLPNEMEAENDNDTWHDLVSAEEPANDG